LHALPLQVVFTRQGIPTAAAAALELACKQQHSFSSTFDSITPLAALSSTARASCAAAIRLELQRLGADEQTLVDDLAVLQAVQQLPVKRQELAALQSQLQKRNKELRQLQGQLQQQQQEEAAQHNAAEDGGTEADFNSTDEQAAEEPDGEPAALTGLVDAATAEVQSMQQQQAALQQLLDEWQQMLSQHKLLAVQFRVEKQQLLEGLLSQQALL
jgi:chromosome segregation ATPase